VKRISLVLVVAVLVTAAIAIPAIARQTVRNVALTPYAAPSLTTFTAAPWPYGQGGGAYHHDGVVTIVGNYSQRSVWDLDTADYALTRVLNDPCGGGNPPCPTVPLTASFGIAWTGKVAYLLGGAQQGLEDYPTNKIWRYDPKANAITDTGVTLPFDWIDGVAAWHPGTREVLLFAGAHYGEIYLKTLMVFDPERGTLETRSTLPQTSDNGCVVYWPERESFIWGMGHSGGKTWRSVYEVQVSGAWRKVGEMPIGIDYPACMIAQGHLVVAGGNVRPNGDDAGPSERSDAVYLMGLDTGHVWQAATLPVPVEPHAWASDGRSLWIINGGGPVQVVQAD
jgi:hypothetical protein